MHVLVVDDDELVRSMLEDVFEQANHTVYIARNATEAMEIIYNEHIEVAIIDWMMPRVSGIELIQQIRTEVTDDYIYIIMLTARADQKDLLTGLAKGADEYLVKPVYREQFLARLQVAQRILEHERNLRSKIKRMEGLANYDHLTGVYNRRAFMDTIPTVIQDLDSVDRPISLLMLDIDHFKRVNDQHGHGVGDIALRQVANFIQQKLAPSDLIARFGGEEFVIVMPNCDKNQAYHRAEELRLFIHSHPIETSISPIYLTVSIGIAQYPEHATAVQDLIDCADQALYSAKRAGRNRSVLYDDMPPS